MTVLPKGGNAPLPTAPVAVAVAGARQGSVDLMVFQLGPDRKVRNDADFVFFNQPRSAEGAVHLVAADRIQIDLSAVPAAVESLAVAVALDDAVRGSLASVGDLGVSVTAGAGAVAVTHQARAAGLTVERAAVLVEIYRRAGAWKLRNVSAGWAAGLAALVREHGVSVDDESVRPTDPVGSPPPDPLPPVALPAGGRQQAVSASGRTASTGVGVPYGAGPAAGAPAGRQAPAAQYQDGPVPGHRAPGGYPPPGGSLPPRPDFVPPQPGGWRPPGGSLQR